MPATISTVGPRRPLSRSRIVVSNGVPLASTRVVDEPNALSAIVVTPSAISARRESSITHPLPDLKRVADAVFFVPLRLLREREALADRREERIAPVLA